MRGSLPISRLLHFTTLTCYSRLTRLPLARLTVTSLRLPALAVVRVGRGCVRRVIMGNEVYSILASVNIGIPAVRHGIVVTKCLMSNN